MKPEKKKEGNKMTRETLQLRLTAANNMRAGGWSGRAAGHIDRRGVWKTLIRGVGAEQGQRWQSHFNLARKRQAHMQESRESEEADLEIEFLVAFVSGIIVCIRQQSLCVCVFVCVLIRRCPSNDSKQDAVLYDSTNLSTNLPTNLLYKICYHKIITINK